MHCQSRCLAFQKGLAAADSTKGTAGRRELRVTKTKNPPFADGDKKNIARYAGPVKSCAQPGNLSCWTFFQQEQLPGAMQSATPDRC